jgi:hypothetical protein
LGCSNSVPLGRVSLAAVKPRGDFQVPRSSHIPPSLHSLLVTLSLITTLSHYHTLSLSLIVTLSPYHTISTLSSLHSLPVTLSPIITLSHIITLPFSYLFLYHRPPSSSQLSAVRPSPCYRRGGRRGSTRVVALGVEGSTRALCFMGLRAGARLDRVGGSPHGGWVL